MNDDTINETEKSDMLLNDTIILSEIHNKNKEANNVNDNEIIINYKNINIENGQHGNISIKFGEDKVSPNTSKYRRFLRLN